MTLQDAIDNGFVASNIFETANINGLMDSIVTTDKNIVVYDKITGETHNYKVIDTNNSQFNKADTSNLSLILYNPRKDGMSTPFSTKKIRSLSISILNGCLII
ncbi:hypothetical protein [Orbus mooreae]|uniref:hypothetical protein n=1 Tax=Orbus mooreae TaxID=3074107 RepID=UPI00370DAE17